ncbi:matrix-remodeling-associated protein 5 isoform X2 [Denticeps clupeoides]|nr:matrix-remodeling-associated protein 5-like isoform X2 [Denticeps clupeoides]
MFEGMTKLVQLHLDHNLIDFIQPYSFIGLTSLKVLQLEGNQLRDLHPHAFVTISILRNFISSSLRQLHLKDNSLEYILQGTLKPLSKLEVLSLHGNPWICDCKLRGLLEWNEKNEGVIKCKKDSGNVENCADCSSPLSLNNSQIFQLTPDQLSCQRPSLESPLKTTDSSFWEETETDLPFTKHLEKALGHLTFALSDGHGNNGHVACDVHQAAERTSVVWETIGTSGKVVANVTLSAFLECEVDRDGLKNLWSLVAYYYDRPAILERGTKYENTSQATFQYSQVPMSDSPYFTDLKGQLMAEPAWLLQHRVSIQLNRQRTTSKKLVLNFSTFISRLVDDMAKPDDTVSSWAMIKRSGPSQVQSVLEGSAVSLECDILSSGHHAVQWVFSDSTLQEESVSERLNFKNVTLSDSGLYHCLVQSGEDIDLLPFRLTVVEREISPGSLNGKQVSVEAGGELILYCSVSSPQPSLTSWFLPQDQIFHSVGSRGRVFVSQNNTLMIKPVTHEDAGQYRCLAANIYGVNMLSHMVVVTGERKKSSGVILLDSEDENDGSGYEETRSHYGMDTKHNIPIQISQKKIKGSARETFKKANKSVKQVDPSRWAQFLAKANAKAPSQHTTGAFQPQITPTASTLDPVQMIPVETSTRTLNYIQTEPSIGINKNILIGMKKDSVTTQSSMQHPHQITRPEDDLTSLISSQRRRPHFRHKRPPLWKIRPSRPSANAATVQTPSTAIPKPTLQLHQEPNVPGMPVTAMTVSVAPINRVQQRPSAPQTERTISPFTKAMDPGVKPRITLIKINRISAFAGTDVNLPCDATGDPEPTVSWTKVSTGATIPANTKHGQRFEVVKNGTFMIRMVQLQDRGQYMCTAQNKLGSDQMVVSLAVTAQPPKIINPLSRNFSVNLGMSLNMDCVAVGKPQAQISWILPDRTFLSELGSSPMASLLLNGTLRIQAVNYSSKGDYKCIASNVAGADTTTYHVHVVASPPTIDEETTENVSVPAGGALYMHCTAKGEPLPVLLWKLPDSSYLKPSQSLSRHLFVFPNGTLHIKSVTFMDAGKYECTATNRVGSARRVLQAEVLTPRQVALQQQTITVIYGSTVYLRCPKSIWSHQSIIWKLPSKELLEQHYSPEGPVTAFPNGTLRISALTEKDSGSYHCLTQKPSAQDIKVFHVDVLMASPEIKNFGNAHRRVASGDNVLVDCIASGHPNPDVSWTLPDGTVIKHDFNSEVGISNTHRYFVFVNGTLSLKQSDKQDEGDYTCYAKNAVGQDKMKVNLRVDADSPRTSFNDQVFIQAVLGESAHIKCDSSIDSALSVIWLSPSNHIISSPSPRYQILSNGTLVIEQVTSADKGMYACVVRKSSGDDIQNVELRVEAREPHVSRKVKKSSVKVSALAYQAIVLDCRAEEIPEAHFTWTTSHGLTLPAPYSDGRFQVHKNGSLEIRGIRKADEGQFECVAKNNFGQAELTVYLEVSTLAEKPSFPMPNIEILPIKLDGNDIYLECPATGKPTPEFTWFLPNSTMLSPSTRLQRFVHVPGNGTLLIARPVAADKGIYRCLAKNVAGQSEKQYELQPGRKPQVRGSGGPLKVSYGQSLNMPCTVDGWPSASITWTLPNGLSLVKPQVIGRITYLANASLHIKDSTAADRGTYTCKATNAFGSSIQSYGLTVIVFPPQITNTLPSILRIGRGLPVTLRCIATGVPTPDISWTLPGRTTLVPSSRFVAQRGIHMTEDGSLVIQDPGLMNSGIYKCNAKNALGMDFKATYVQVI